ncbi:hypothetical protein L484_015790 [Morus notabilis]|uniref:Secreted protein n=1 Tax=Morus notabilis TaxID=981085 RepID=W9QY59_9ROSA|nr:hypothetical protein L484_015790 [Morus notabilis]
MRDLYLTLSVMTIAIILSTSHSGLGASAYSTAPTGDGPDTSICLHNIQIRVSNDLNRAGCHFILQYQICPATTNHTTLILG